MQRNDYRSLYETLERDGKATLHFKTVTYIESDDMPVEIRRLRRALSKWAQVNGKRVTTRFDCTELKLTATILS